MVIVRKHRQQKQQSDRVQQVSLNLEQRPLKMLARMVAEQLEFHPLPSLIVSWGLIADLNFAFAKGWNQTSVWVGGPGEGKSRGAWRLGKEWKALTGQKFVYCWDIDHIPECNDGYHLHIDEWLLIEGTGKIHELQRLKNLYDTSRVKQINISVSTPTSPAIPFATFEATTHSQDFTNRINMFEVRVPLPRYGLVYIGNALIPLGEDDEAWLKYERESYARKTAIWESKGKKIVDVKFDAQELAKEVIDWAQENKFSISTQGIATTFVRKLAQEREWDTNYATEPDIINWVKILMEKDDFTKDVFVPTPSEGWNGLRKALWEWLVKSKKMNKKTAHYLADWYVSKQIHQGKIGEQYGVSRDQVNTSISTYDDIFTGSESQIGKIAEAWFKLHTDSLSSRAGGGHKNDPDILLTVPVGEGDGETGKGKGKGKEVAVNVKWALTEPKFRRSFDSTPEDQWAPNAVLAVINSNQKVNTQTTTETPVIRLYPLAEPTTYAHYQKGVPCAPEELAARILDMFGKDEDDV